MTNIRYALRHLRKLYGHTQAADFGPLALKAVREQIISTGICRNEVNRRTRIIVRAFKWATENELIPASAHHGLKAVSGLRRGRSEARETDQVKPVPGSFVEAVEPFVSPQIWAVIRLQSLTGMRPGEVCAMRTCDIDVSGRVWVYRPHTHKTEHHGRQREIYLVPSAQTVLRPWLRPELERFLFSPAEAMERSLAERRRNRRSPMTPSQGARTKKSQPRKAPGAKYTPDSYRSAVGQACRKADVPAWNPNRLRHNAATRLRKEFGLDVARVILGHSTSEVSEVYAEVDREKAIRIMGEVG